MAIGGGTFTVQNKILPGAYINFVSAPRALGSLGERGTVAGAMELNFGKENEVITVTLEQFQKESLKIFGYSYTSDEMLSIRELFRGANTLKLYRINSGGNKATVTIGNLKAEALYGGTRGNDIKISIEADVDDQNKFYVTTFLDNQAVDEQVVSSAEQLIPNDFATFSGIGELEETAGIPLSGGANKQTTGNDYSMFLEKIEAENFQTLFYAGEDETTKALFTSFTKRLKDNDGYKITTVLHDYTKADYEGVISVKNIANYPDKTALVYWVAGQSAGAEVNQTLTNKTYDGELEVETKFKKQEFEQHINTGQFAFYDDNGTVKVLKDINTFTSYTPEKNADFSNNQVIRVLDEVANSVARIFKTFYLGKVQNEATGRNLFKAELINYYNQLQSIRAITNFEPNDIVINKGVEKGDVTVTGYIEPVGAMDKLYMTVNVV